jgi:uncharacterized membrane protein YgcG
MVKLVFVALIKYIILLFIYIRILYIIYTISLNMKLTKTHLFVILLLALVFCSFLGGACGGGSTLEGLNMPSRTTPYDGTGQYSDKQSSYGNLYSANDKFSKQQDAEYDRKDKIPADDAHDTSKYAPYDGSGSGSSSSGSSSGSSSRRGQGIPASQIPPGQEDLYMLKSEMVPPVCPACPAMKCDASSSGGGDKKCPPCPPCARCPEPAFECKKVPNYNSSNDDVLPRPILNSFSQFGM